jgi:hypothetical protein
MLIQINLVRAPQFFLLEFYARNSSLLSFYFPFLDQPIWNGLHMVPYIPSTPRRNWIYDIEETTNITPNGHYDRSSRWVTNLRRNNRALTGCSQEISHILHLYVPQVDHRLYLCHDRLHHIWFYCLFHTGYQLRKKTIGFCRFGFSGYLINASV